MPRRISLSGLGLLLFFFGCKNGDDRIQTYRVSKEGASDMPMAAAPMMGGGAPPPAGMDMPSMGAGMAPAASPKEISWTVPEGWKEQPPSQMRVGSFLAKGENSGQADISVVPLSGVAGGDLANINRWRGQINLEPISETELSQNSQTITPGGRKMLLVDFISREPLIENRYKKRLVAAIYTQGQRSWFFKMMGDEVTVGAQKSAFQKFLQSLHFAQP